MKIKNLFIISLFFFSSTAFARNAESGNGDTNELPLPAQIFPNDPQRTQEDSDRNEREMREYNEDRKAQDERPD